MRDRSARTRSRMDSTAMKWRRKSGLAIRRSSPSAKAVAREREAIRELTGNQQRSTALKEVIGDINSQVNGWANYFQHGYPTCAYRKINAFVRQRLVQFCKRRSQRRQKPPGEQSYYGMFAKLGLVYLRKSASSTHA